jgi:thiamine-phosphate pyrophosphorylase
MLQIVAIGGITPENAEAVWQAGADSVAIISSLAEAEDVEQQVERFKESYRKESMI